jgi:hypothetical protein
MLFPAKRGHHFGSLKGMGVVKFDKEASQTRDYCVAKTRRFARLA